MRFLDVAKRLFLVGCLFVMGESSAVADPLDRNARLLELIRRMTEDHVHTLVNDAFLPNVRAAKPELEESFKRIKLNIYDSFKPKAVSRIDNDGPVIEISTGYAFIAFLYTEYAIIRNYYFDTHNAKCSQYMTYLGKQFSEINDFQSFDFNNRLIYAPYYCGVQHLEKDQSYISRIDNMLETDRVLYSVLGMVLGHEYGHHLLGHLPPKDVSPEASRRIELEADYFGSNILGRFASRASGVLIFRFLENYRRVDPFYIARRHPAEECRFLYLSALDANYNSTLSNRYFAERRIDLYEYTGKLLSAVDAAYVNEAWKTRCDGLYQTTPEPMVKSEPGTEFSKCIMKANQAGLEMIKSWRRLELVGASASSLSEKQKKACELLPVIRARMKASESAVTACRERYKVRPDNADVVAGKAQGMFEQLVAVANCPAR